MEAAKVGQAIYHAAADYDWGYNINIVKLTVENAKISCAGWKWLSYYRAAPSSGMDGFENETHHRGTGNRVEVKRRAVYHGRVRAKRYSGE